MPRQVAIVLPSVATLCSLIFGTLAVIVLYDNNFLVAGLLIILGSILDVLDGRLANRLNTTSSIGKELDSLADIVTFGVAPTMLVYHLFLIDGVAKPVAILTSLPFVVAGAYRLARFNVITSSAPPGYFKGMPIPAASMLLITGSFSQQWEIHTWWFVMVLLVSYLMVSPITFYKITRLVNIPVEYWAAFLLLVIGCGLTLGWHTVPFIGMLAYTISGPLFAAKWQKEGS